MKNLSKALLLTMTLLPLSLGFMLAVVPGLASADKIIADVNSCTDQGEGVIRCCGNSGTKTCPEYTGCSTITDENSPYQGAWRCDSVEIRCEDGSGTDFSECNIELIPAKQGPTPG